MGTRFRRFSPVSLVGSALSVGIAPPTGRQTQCRLEPPDAIRAALASLGAEQRGHTRADRYKVPDFALQTAIRGLTSASCAHQLRKSGLPRRDWLDEILPRCTSSASASSPTARSGAGSLREHQVAGRPRLRRPPARTPPLAMHPPFEKRPPRRQWRPLLLCRAGHWPPPDIDGRGSGLKTAQCEPHDSHATQRGRLFARPQRWGDSASTTTAASSRSGSSEAFTTASWIARAVAAVRRTQAR